MELSPAVADELRGLLFAFDVNAVVAPYVVRVYLSSDGSPSYLVAIQPFDASSEAARAALSRAPVLPRPQAKAAAKARAQRDRSRSRSPQPAWVAAVAGVAAPPSPRTPEEYVEGCKLSFFVFALFTCFSNKTNVFF